MFLEILAVVGGVHLFDELTKPTKQMTIVEKYTDKAGILWMPDELYDFSKRERISMFGYDPIFNE